MKTSLSRLTLGTTLALTVGLTANAAPAPAPAAKPSSAQPKAPCTPEQLHAGVVAIVAELLGISPTKLHMKSSLIELGADSLNCVEITMALEDEFNIEIADQDAETHKTVQGIVDYLMTRNTSSAAPRCKAKAA